ncbi:MAG: hypothetical protein ACLVJ6_10620 [Merdibacter sp.]
MNGMNDIEQKKSLSVMRLNSGDDLPVVGLELMPCMERPAQTQ